MGVGNIGLGVGVGGGAHAGLVGEPVSYTHLASENIPLSYKGHPLRRKDNLIYYGTMAEKYIIMLQILSTKTVNLSLIHIST